LEQNHGLFASKHAWENKMALTLRPNDKQVEEIERLKQIFDVGTASKALLLAGRAYLVQRVVLQKVAKSHAALEARFNRLVDLEQEKLLICNQIEEIRDAGTSDLDYHLPADLDEISKIALKNYLTKHEISHRWLLPG
jgi:hypothetical protein